MYNRVFNFSAGPSVLPVEVIEKVQSELLNYQGDGRCGKRFERNYGNSG